MYINVILHRFSYCTNHKYFQHSSNLVLSGSLSKLLLGSISQLTLHWAFDPGSLLSSLIYWHLKNSENGYMQEWFSDCKESTSLTTKIKNFSREEYLWFRHTCDCLYFGDSLTDASTPAPFFVFFVRRHEGERIFSSVSFHIIKIRHNKLDFIHIHCICSS